MTTTIQKPKGSFEMIMLIIAFTMLLFAALTSCKKEDQRAMITQPQQQSAVCTVDIEQFKDVNWIHGSHSLATLYFDSTGVYYENGNFNGMWTLTNECDSIFITRPSNSFFYVIKSVSADTLLLVNPNIGVVTYVR